MAYTTELLKDGWESESKAFEWLLKIRGRVKVASAKAAPLQNAYSRHATILFTVSMHAHIHMHTQLGKFFTYVLVIPQALHSRYFVAAFHLHGRCVPCYSPAGWLDAYFGHFNVPRFGQINCFKHFTKVYKFSKFIETLFLF